MMCTRKKEHAFTLLEIMLYTSIAAMLLYAVSLLYTVTIANDSRNIARISTEESAIHLLLVITDAIRRSTSVVEPGALSTSDFLVLEMSNSEIDPTIISFSEGHVVMQEGDGDPIRISTSNVIIDSFEFSNRSNTSTSSTVHIEFEAHYVNQSGRPELEYSSHYYGGATTK